MGFPLFSRLFLFYYVSILFTTHEVLVCGRCLEDQRHLLLQLKQSLSFDYPSNSIPVDSKLASWNRSTDCCGWKGVTCDGVSGRVTGLDLSNEYITGGIDNSSSLFNLRHLQSLNLAMNYFLDSTPIPSELVKLVDLTHLNLSYMDFEGQIPIEISHLTRLVSLDLSSIYRNLRLEKPDLKTLVQNLSRLRTLCLDGVNMSANGNQWGRSLSSSLPNLQVLSLHYCHLSGPIPPLPETLTQLNLAFNSLTGPLPDSIWKRLRLISLDLSANKLTGPLPTFAETLTQLNLAYNSLTGPLPNSLRKRLRLISLDLSGNHFTGPIPPMPENLTRLNLAKNSLTGSLRGSLWKRLVKLVDLDLSVNSLNGTIPSFLFTLPTLENLDLGQNQFDGQLMEFTSNSSLSSLDLSSNMLEGPIPLSIFELRQLTLLALSSNNFNGTIQLEMIQKLQKLDILDLSYNSLLIDTTVPESNSSFPRFSVLNLASCKLRCFPDFLRRNQSTLYALDLSDNQIHGQIPTWIWEIESLVHLNLSFNLLNSLEQPLPNPSYSLLAFLDLHSNLLEGPIPILSSRLTHLDFSHNRLHSIIPSNLIGSTSNTFFLSLSSNTLTGEIPQSICNAGLLVLDLSNNRLSGTIPSCLGNMSKTLQTLDLSGNILGGPLPRDLAHCTKLQVVNLGSNRLNGIFPFWLGSCTDLRVLVLRSNRFSGPIKGDGSNHTFSKLQILDLSWNHFTGNLPTEFFMKWAAMKVNKDQPQSMIKAEALGIKLHDMMANRELFSWSYNTLGGRLYYQDTVVVSIKGRTMELTKILTIDICVDLSNNGLQGEIPDVIGNLTALYTLNLSHNALTGPIPSSMGNLKQLESLDLSFNKLQGEIPQQLASLTFLSSLNLSWNDLTGRIPTGPQFQTFNETSFGGNEGLCGTPLSRNCRGIVPAALAPVASSSKKPQLVGYDWDIVLSGFVVGFGGGAGIVVAFFLFSDPGRKWLMSQNRS